MIPGNYRKSVEPLSGNINYRFIPIMFLVFFFISCTSRNMLHTGEKTEANTKRQIITYIGEISGKPTVIPSRIKRIITIAQGGCKQIPFHRPVAIDVDSSGKIFVLDADLKRVLVYPDIKYTCEDIQILAEGRLNNPSGMAISASKIFISDQVPPSVKIFSREGKFLRSFSDTSQLSKPGEMAVDEHSGRIFIVDTPHHRVQVFTLSMDFIKTLGGKEGNHLDQLHSPSDVTLDKEGNIYIVDTINRRIVKYKKDFTPVRIYGVYDLVPGAFSFPRAAAVDKNMNLLICDSQFGNIQIFHNNGALLYYFGENGREKGQFYLPIDLATDSHNRIFVADQFNNRVQIFQINQ